MKIEYGKIPDVSNMLALDYKIFPKEWHLSEHFVAEILKKNPEVYRVLHDQVVSRSLCNVVDISRSGCVNA